MALTDVGTRVTDLPVRGSPLPSLRMTSTVALELPSAGTVVRLATMSESATTGPVGGGVPKVTTTSSPTSGRLSVVSVARNLTISVVASVTLNTAWPAVFVVTPEAGEIVDDPFTAVKVM